MPFIPPQRLPAQQSACHLAASLHEAHRLITLLRQRGWPTLSVRRVAHPDGRWLITARRDAT